MCSVGVYSNRLGSDDPRISFSSLVKMIMIMYGSSGEVYLDEFCTL